MVKILKILIRCTAFTMVFSFVFSYLTGFVIRKDDETNEIHAFYGEADNSLDVLFVGSSPFLRGISPMAMYENRGFTSYVRAAALQAPSVTYGLLAEMLENQSPKLVVIYCDYIFNEYDYAEREGDMRRNLDGMRISLHKLRIIKEVVEADEKQSFLSYMFPLFRFHDRWKEIKIGESEPIELLEHSYKKGHAYLEYSDPQQFPENFMIPTGDSAPPFDENARMYTEKMIEICKEKGIDVLLLHMPKMTWTYEQSLAVENFAMEKGVDFLDLDKEENRLELDIDPESEYYDKGHMNLQGAIKLSKWLGNYLDEKYDLPERRNDSAYEIWNEDLAVYKEKTKMN